MANDSSKGCVRFLGAAFGGLLGALGVAIYMRRRWMFDPGEPAAHPSEPVQGIVLKPAEESSSFGVVLSADPFPLVRNQPVTIRARTVPGATCALTALYSTGYAPNSLGEGAATADGDGVCAWTWEVGTSGSYVDVAVEAQKGDETATDEARFEITG